MPGLDANMEMDPSDISDMDDKVLPDAGQKPDDAASSTAANDETDGELLSIARDAIRKTVETTAPASSADGVDNGSEDGADEQPKKQDDENYSDVPFHKHPRFQSLLAKTKKFEDDAGRYRNVETFLSNNGLSAEEAADALVIAGLMKMNPVEAWNRLRPTLEKLVVAAGVALPQDLQQRVQSGEITQDVALEISRARAAQNSVEFARQFETRQRETNAVKELNASLQDAAQTWENNRRLKDPNYADKAQAVQEKVLFLLHTEGRPTTPQGVRAQLQKAYEAVNASYRPPAPQPAKQPMKPVTGGQISGKQSAPAPTNTADLIRSVVARQGA